MFKFKKDSALLAAAGDRIDNAVFAFICAAATEENADSEKTKFVLLTAVNELSIEHIDNLPDGLLADAAAIAAELAEENHLKDEASELPLRWDMCAIGEMTDYIERRLSKCFGINTCHPWQDDAECICYACEERCSYCEKTVQ